jgi:dienelactone hydrolase
VRSSGWDAAYRFDRGDPRSNTLHGSFPLPKASHWRVQAVTAQADGTVMNVAFRGVNEHAAFEINRDVASQVGGASASQPAQSGQGTWFEDDQAAALASGDISRFGTTVSTADLRPGVHRLQAVGPGLHERVYTSRYALGEGFSYAGIPGRGDGGTAKGFDASVYNLLGRYQPYGIYLPKAPGRLGLQMVFHGTDSGLAGLINQPGMQQRFGEDLHRALVVPEARGQNGFGADISERDLLDVMADAQHAYSTDPDRTFSSGYSQGGYLAFRMAMLHPDLFAGFTSWVGFAGDNTDGTPAEGSVSVTAGAVGNMMDYVGNLRHVPGEMLYAGEDEFETVSSNTAMERAFAATDDVYTWWMHPAADHLTFAIADDWVKESAASRTQRRVRRPARVTFRTDTALDAPQYGIRHDRAYWVSGLRGRSSGPMSVDLTSHGCGVEVPVLTTDQGAGTAPVPWLALSQARTGTRRLPAEQLLEGTLTGVGQVTLDLARACLRPGAAYRLVTDVPVVLHLAGGRALRLPAGSSRGTLP